MHNLSTVTPYATLGGGAGNEIIADAVSLTALPHCVKINIRAEQASGTAAVSQVTGLALPDVPNTCQHNDRGSLFWLGPDEWQFRTAGENAEDWVVSFRDALQGTHAAVVDVSDYYVVMNLQGSAHLDVMEKLTPLNVRVLLSGLQQCAQTRFANAPVLLHRTDLDAVHLQVRWSYAEYLWTYLLDAMHEFR